MRWSAKSLFPALGGGAAAPAVAGDGLRAPAMAPVGRTHEFMTASSEAPPAAPVLRTPAQPAPAAQPMASEAPREAQPPKVLLAEDHPVNRKVVELILASIGAEITVAENGAEAVDAFQAAKFDVVLMDMQMPVMDGLAATRAIRAWELETGQARTPILSLTANAMPEHTQASMDAGADAHLTKPVSAAGLITAVRHAQSGGYAAEPLRRAG